ncbi:hypothetical protein Pelo_17200 [Pelomyxa schiedti]|nr:hypothetical protein Pelo_17200 [Pelomyxa schiedti]
MSTRPHQKYHVSVKENRLLDINEIRNFCSEHCAVSSKLFQSQLSSDPITVRTKPHPVHVVENADGDSVIKPPTATTGTERCIEGYKPKEKLSHTEALASAITKASAVSTPTPVSTSKLPITPAQQLTATGGPISSEPNHVESCAPLPVPKPATPHTADKTSGQLDLFDVEPFAAPQLSPFGQVILALNRWCTDSTHKYLQGKSTEIPSLEEHFQYGEMDDADEEHLNSIVTMRLDALTTQVINTMRSIALDLEFEPGECQGPLTELVNTFCLALPIPNLLTKQWHLLTLSFLEALSQSSTPIHQQLHGEQNKIAAAASRYSLDSSHIECLRDTLWG